MRTGKTGPGHVALAGLSLSHGHRVAEGAGPYSVCTGLPSGQSGLGASLADVPPQADADFLRRDVVEPRTGRRRSDADEVPGVRIAQVEEAVADIEVQAARLGVGGP